LAPSREALRSTFWFAVVEIAAARRERSGAAPLPPEDGLHQPPLYLRSSLGSFTIRLPATLRLEKVPPIVRAG